jgi:hypothetical protein
MNLLRNSISICFNKIIQDIYAFCIFRLFA